MDSEKINRNKDLLLNKYNENNYHIKKQENLIASKFKESCENDLIDKNNCEEYLKKNSVNTNTNSQSKLIVPLPKKQLSKNNNINKIRDFNIVPGIEKENSNQINNSKRKNNSIINNIDYNIALSNENFIANLPINYNDENKFDNLSNDINKLHEKIGNLKSYFDSILVFPRNV